MSRVGIIRKDRLASLPWQIEDLSSYPKAGELELIAWCLKNGISVTSKPSTAKEIIALGKKLTAIQDQIKLDFDRAAEVYLRLIAIARPMGLVKENDK